ncbi:MAG: hypothetical protein COA78_17485 [Blastopirellula sp.]|nr:MAG: hypothetical protein COA78_17485 [Blastopirellula sp.]
MYNLTEMLTYCRPEGSQTQREFCKRFIEPAMGCPDKWGNYLLELGDKPSVCFAAHHDTVHFKDGIQRVDVTGDVVSLPFNSTSSCLGADCTTGVWLILNMIEEGVPGFYIIHAAEELGCDGSSALVASEPDWLTQVDSVISLDRMGTESIITHQMGTRTASDEFAVSLSGVLDLPALRPDDSGSYTDSNEYRGVVSECTNLSVGYFGQHTKRETQDLWFADVILERMIDADWSQLDIVREPVLEDPYAIWESYYKDYGTGSGWKVGSPVNEKNDYQKMYEFIKRYPDEVSEMLVDWGLDTSTMAEDLNIQDPEYINNYLNGGVIGG